MRISRIVSTDFWEDGLVTDSFSPEDKYFMLYLMTNPHSKQAGIYKLNKKIAAFEMGYSAETVFALLDRFEHKYHRIIYSSDTQEVAVLNAPKYNIVKGGKPVLDCVEKDLSEVKDKSLIARMYQHLKAYFEQSDKPSIQQVGEVWKKASNNFKEVNEIDNDNDRIVDVSLDESYHESLEEEADKIFLEFPLQDGTKYAVTESMITEWESVYSKVDVHQAVKEMRMWLIANPTKQKTHRGTPKFVTGWLMKENEKASAQKKTKSGGDFLC